MVIQNQTDRPLPVEIAVTAANAELTEGQGRQATVSANDRVEAFAWLLGEGVFTYSYVARATTPGTYVVPAARAEDMYHPETFGRGGTDRVVVAAGHSVKQ